MIAELAEVDHVPALGDQGRASLGGKPDTTNPFYFLFALRSERVADARAGVARCHTQCARGRAKIFSTPLSLSECRKLRSWARNAARRAECRDRTPRGGRAPIGEGRKWCDRAAPVHARRTVAVGDEVGLRGGGRAGGNRERRERNRVQARPAIRLVREQRAALRQGGRGSGLRAYAYPLELNREGPPPKDSRGKNDGGAPRRWAPGAPAAPARA